MTYLIQDSWFLSLINDKLKKSECEYHKTNKKESSCKVLEEHQVVLVNFLLALS